MHETLAHVIMMMTAGLVAMTPVPPADQDRTGQRPPRVYVEKGYLETQGRGPRCASKALLGYPGTAGGQPAPRVQVQGPLGRP